MSLEATQEQRAAREVFASGADLTLVAGAGTGKTSTLMMMADVTSKHGLYMAFNKTTAADAQRRFSRNVECRTAHSIAFAATGRTYRHRLDAPRLPARETARLLGINADLHAGAGKITRFHQARLVMGMIKRYCYSSAAEVMARHMEVVNGLEPAEEERLARILLPYAQKAWEDICAPNGRLRFEHDHYMKLWALTNPELPGDFIMLDEAQDTNPVLEEIFLAQRAQRVCVGDPAQQIYAWRSARDVMTGFPALQLHLTQSFRFGPLIAEVANRWLSFAGSSMRLTGAGPPDSRIGKAAHTDAVLCRNNADVMDAWRPAWPALGQAIDYRLRLSLGCQLGDAVHIGVETIASDEPLPGAPSRPARTALAATGYYLLAVVDRFLAGTLELEDRWLTRLCFAASFFEDVYRTGEITQNSMLHDASPRTDLRTLAKAVPAYAVADIAAQMELAQPVFAPFRALPQPRIKCGPVFAGSTDIGGADADFIIDGRLLDCKATTTPTRLGSTEVGQLAGYLLLDYENQYQVTEVGLYLSRHGTAITWPVPEFLRLTGTREPLPQLRGRLREHLRRHRDQ